MMHRVKYSKSLVESGGVLMIKKGLSVLQRVRFVPSLERLAVSDVGGGVSSSVPILGSRRFFNTGGGIATTESSSSLVKRDMFRAGDIPNLFRGRQTGGCVGSFVPHQCNKSHMMLPYFARALASSSASQSSGQTTQGQTTQQEPTKKKRECQIIRSSKLQRERCDEISSSKVSLNQFPGLMVDGIDKNSKTRRLLRLNPDTGYFEEQDDVADLQVPNGHVCRGSAYGWLFLTDDNLDMKLFNPFSRAEIQLPPVKTLPPPKGEEQWDLSKWFVAKAVFSANPSIEPRPVVLVIYGGLHLPRLAFCKPGDQVWTPLEFPVYSRHMDVIFHKGQFYALGWPGYVATFDIGRRLDDDDHSVKTDIVAIPPERDVIYVRDWYLVVLDGELVRFELREACFRDCCINETTNLLARLRNRDGDTTDQDYSIVEDYIDEESGDVDGNTGEESDENNDDGNTDEENDDDDDGKKESMYHILQSDDDDGKKESMYRILLSDDDDGIKESMYAPCVDRRLPARTYGVKIRWFDVSEKQWVKVESLGDKAVFLGYNTSFALSASDCPGGLCIPDSVYFTYGGGGNEGTEMFFYDMGIYNVKDKTVKPIYPPMNDEEEDFRPFLKPAPIWIVNSAS